MAAKRQGRRGGERERGAGRGRRECPGSDAPKDPGRGRDMVMVDPWGALLEQLLEVPEEGTGTGEEAPKRK